MPYVPLLAERPDPITVADNAKICRYMDLAGLANLLFTKKLKMTPICEMQDRTEGRWQIFGKHPENRHTVEILRKCTAVSCWSITTEEEIAMWESFARGPYGVLVRTTVGDLKAAFDVTNYTVYLNQVSYHPRPPMDPVPIHQALAMKSAAFEYQNEIRVVTKEGWDKLTSMVAGHIIVDDSSPFANTSSVDLRMIDVDVHKLVQEVVMSPHADTALTELVRGFLSHTGMVGVPVSESTYRRLFG